MVGGLGCLGFDEAIGFAGEEEQGGREGFLARNVHDKVRPPPNIFMGDVKSRFRRIDVGKRQGGFLSLRGIPPVPSTSLLRTNIGCVKERRILIGPW